MPGHSLRVRVNTDFDFVSQMEGGCRSRGYILVAPDHAGGRKKYIVYTGDRPWNDAWEVIGKLGVTIGTGVDLGQMKPAEISALGLSAHATAKLLPFAGLKGKEAGRLLARFGGVQIEEGDAKKADNRKASAIYEDRHEKPRRDAEARKIREGLPVRGRTAQPASH